MILYLSLMDTNRWSVNLQPIGTLYSKFGLRLLLRLWFSHVNLCWNTCSGDICRQSLNYNASCSNFSIVTNGDVADDNGTGTYDHILAQLWVSVMCISRAAQGHIVEDAAAVPDDGCLSNHDALCVVKHDTDSYFTCWVDINAEDLRYSAL